MKDFIQLLLMILSFLIVGGILYVSCQKLCMLLFRRRFVLKKCVSIDDVPDFFFTGIVLMGTGIIVGCFFSYFF